MIEALTLLSVYQMFGQHTKEKTFSDALASVSCNGSLSNTCHPLSSRFQQSVQRHCFVGILCMEEERLRVTVWIESKNGTKVENRYTVVDAGHQSVEAQQCAGVLAANGARGAKLPQKGLLPVDSCVCCVHIMCFVERLSPPYRAHHRQQGCAA